MAKFNYMRVSTSNDVGYLNSLGLEGWEICGIDSKQGVIYLKCIIEVK